MKRNFVWLCGVILAFLTGVSLCPGSLPYQLGRFAFWLANRSSTFWTAIAAIIAGVSAGIAAISTLLSYWLLRAQNEPHVVIYVKHDESRQSILMIVIENIGNTTASDLKFILSRPLPANAYGVDEKSVLNRPSTTMTDGVLIHGIPALGPKDSRKVNWGQYYALNRALSGEAIPITCNYKHGKRQMPTVSALLEVNSFAGVAALETEGARTIRELKRIADALDAVKAG